MVADGSSRRQRKERLHEQHVQMRRAEEYSRNVGRVLEYLLLPGERLRSIDDDIPVGSMETKHGDYLLITPLPNGSHEVISVEVKLGKPDDGAIEQSSASSTEALLRKYAEIPETASLVQPLFSAGYRVKDGLAVSPRESKTRDYASRVLTVSVEEAERYAGKNKEGTCGQ
jgi:hypothetical protein